MNAATERLKRAKDAVLAAVCRKVLICPGDAVAVEYREALAAWLDAGILEGTEGSSVVDRGLSEDALDQVDRKIVELIREADDKLVARDDENESERLRLKGFVVGSQSALAILRGARGEM